MKNIQFNIWEKMTDFKDNFSQFCIREVSFSIRDNCRERYLDELMHAWSMMRTVERNLKRKVW